MNINPKIAKKLQINERDIVKPYLGTEESIVVK